MHRTKLIIIIAVLTAFLLLTPVMALPKVNTQFSEKISMTAGNISTGNQVIQDNVLFVVNGISTGTITVISGVDLTGQVWTKLSGYYDLETGTGIFVGKWQISTQSGSFSGNVVGTITTIDSSTFQIRGTYVGFGTDSYQGDRIKGSIAGYAVAGTLVVNLDMQGTFSDKP